jgi:hypothetical protein
MNRHEQATADAAELLEKVRTAVGASDRDPASVLDEVAELIGHRRRPQELYQKPLG